MVFAKEIVFILSLFALLFITSSFAYGADVSWETCPSGSAISRCQTINCPQGDTNKDGSCTLEDSFAELVSARNDSLCANPPSGCGEVLYYETNATEACTKRVKESGSSCNLYSTTTPKFDSPSPKPTVSPTSVASASAKTLPATGPEDYIVPVLMLTTFTGAILFVRFH